MAATRVIVVAALAATVAAPAPAAARSSGACARRGATVAADSQARVFRRGRVASGETKGAPLYYGCSLRTGHIRRLNRDGDFGINRVSAIRLAGPYVAYVESDVEALGVVPFAIVVDVRNGRIIRHPPAGDSEDGGEAITALVVTARGTEAWIARVTNEYRVSISDATGNRVVAHSMTIARHSLALAANGHSIYWTDAGVPRAAPID